MIDAATHSLAVVLVSWLIGLVVLAPLKQAALYRMQLSNLNFVRSDGLNAAIGLGLIKWMVLHTPFKLFNPNLKLSARVTMDDLDRLRGEMTAAEVSHLIAFVFAGLVTLTQFWQRDWLAGLTLLALNVLMNLYPSLLQQANKRRIDSVMRKHRLRAPAAG